MRSALIYSSPLRQRLSIYSLRSHRHSIAKLSNQDAHANQKHPQRENHGIHSIVPTLTKSNSANAKPRKAIQRGTIRVRSEIVEVGSVGGGAVAVGIVGSTAYLYKNGPSDSTSETSSESSFGNNPFDGWEYTTDVNQYGGDDSSVDDSSVVSDPVEITDPVPVPVIDVPDF